MMKGHLQDRRGFTLIEVLCAFLILALSASLLFTGIGAAGSVNQLARTSQQKFYTELSTAEGQAAAEAEGEARFYSVDASGAVDTSSYGSRAVEYYREEDGALCSYAIK